MRRPFFVPEDSEHLNVRHAAGESTHDGAPAVADVCARLGDNDYYYLCTCLVSGGEFAPVRLLAFRWRGMNLIDEVDPRLASYPSIERKWRSMSSPPPRRRPSARRKSRRSVVAVLLMRCKQASKLDFRTSTQSERLIPMSQLAVEKNDRPFPRSLLELGNVSRGRISIDDGNIFDLALCASIAKRNSSAQTRRIKKLLRSDSRPEETRVCCYDTGVESTAARALMNSEL